MREMAEPTYVYSIPNRYQGLTPKERKELEGQESARDFLNTQASTYGVAELVVAEALKDASPDFVRMTIELVHYGMGQWEWQLSYRYMITAFNTLVSS